MFACIPSLPSTSLNNATRVVHEVSSNPTRPKTRVKKSRANHAQGLPKTAKDSEKVYLSRQAATASPMQYTYICAVLSGPFCHGHEHYRDIALPKNITHYSYPEQH